MSKTIREWKKVYKADLDYVVGEFKGLVEAPACILLTGELGVGKTSFVSSFFPKAQITSPSYSLVNEIGNIVHCDFYRINDPSEIIELELDLYMEEKDFLLIEWGKKYYPSLARLFSELNFYELVFKLNPKSELDKEYVSREITLFQLDLP